MAGSLQTGDRRVRPRLGLRHGTPLASRDVPRERGRLSSCLWNLAFFSERCTQKLPLRDFIHRVEFGEVSGHRVLIKRGPGNRGPTECGTTHEAIFSNESALCIRRPKYWSFSFSIRPSNKYSGLISFRINWFDLLAVQGTLKSLLQHHSSKALVLWHSAFFMVQLSRIYWKNHEVK